MNKFSHTDEQGKANMVDVGGKAHQLRAAKATGKIVLAKETVQLIQENQIKKGDVLTIANIAGIQAAKATSSLIPLCHPLPLTHVELNLTPLLEKNAVYCQTTVKTNGQTGVEMEALCATQIALLTIYDMCKAVDRGMVIQSVRLLEKDGGKSGHWQLANAE